MNRALTAMAKAKTKPATDDLAPSGQSAARRLQPMNIINKTARQGDVMLIRIDKLPDGLIATKRDKLGRIVLAHSEKSGHGHAIRDKSVCGFRLASTTDDPTGVSGGVDYIEVGGSSTATLNHEYESGKMAEHEPIGLPPGVYKVALQREYTPQAIVRAQD